MVLALNSDEGLREEDGSSVIAQGPRLSKLQCAALITVTLIGVSVLLYLASPIPTLTRERRAQLRLADSYLESMGLPRMPGGKLVEPVVKHEHQFEGTCWTCVRVVFHYREDFSNVKAWYERAYPSPPWDTQERNVPAFAYNWKARVTGENHITVRVSRPARAAFTAVVYDIRTQLH